MAFMRFFDVELVGREAAEELVGVVVVGHYEGRVEEVGADVFFQHDLSSIETEGSLKVGRPELRISSRAFSIAIGINTSENRSTIQDFLLPQTTIMHRRFRREQSDTIGKFETLENRKLA
jgi:hypothetical protein